jgi:sugar phosphate isomerase/epimerase
MDFGVSLICMAELSMAEAFAKVKAAGFSRVELSWYDNPVGRWWHDPEGTRDALKRAGLAAPTLHSPQAGWNNDAVDEVVRRASVDAASATFAPAARAGVDVVVVHPNTPGEGGHTAEAFEANIARARESVAMLAERAAKAGVRVALENMPMRGTPRPGGPVEDTLRLIDGLGDHVGVCFDVGHSNANVDNPAEEICIAAEKIFCVHIQDNDGLGEDQHLLPGQGTTDWPRVIAALERHAPDAYVTFEIGAVDPLTGAPRDVDELLATLASLCAQWTDK